MSEEKKYYCFCGSNCKYETMTKEQILSAIEQAARGEPVLDPDAGVLTKVKEKNNGGYITFWVGTQAQYNALKGNIEQGCVYIITDATTDKDINEAMQKLTKDMEEVKVSAESALNVAAKANRDTNEVIQKFTKDIESARVSLQNTLDEAAKANKTEERTGTTATITKIAGAGSAQIQSIDVRTHYNKALGMAKVWATISLAGQMAEYDEYAIVLPSGLHKRIDNSEYRFNPLACFCMANTFGIDACMLTGTQIKIRVNKNTATGAGTQKVFIEGWYPCRGEVL